MRCPSIGFDTCLSPCRLARRLRPHSCQLESVFALIGYVGGTALIRESCPRYYHIQADTKVRVELSELFTSTYQFNIGTHLGYLTNLNHYKFVYFWIFLLVISHCDSRKMIIVAQPQPRVARPYSRPSFIDKLWVTKNDLGPLV